MSMTIHEFGKENEQVIVSLECQAPLYMQQYPYAFDEKRIENRAPCLIYSVRNKL